MRNNCFYRKSEIWQKNNEFRIDSVDIGLENVALGAGAWPSYLRVEKTGGWKTSMCVILERISLCLSTPRRESGNLYHQSQTRQNPIEQTLLGKKLHKRLHLSLIVSHLWTWFGWSIHCHNSKCEHVEYILNAILETWTKINFVDLMFLMIWCIEFNDLSDVSDFSVLISMILGILWF